jgi:hypothetical protein
MAEVTIQMRLLAGKWRENRTEGGRWLLFGKRDGRKDIQHSRGRLQWRVAPDGDWVDVPVVNEEDIHG